MTLNDVPLTQISRSCHYLTLNISEKVRDTKNDAMKNDVISEKLAHCIFIFWVNTQQLTG